MKPNLTPTPEEKEAFEKWQENFSYHLGDDWIKTFATWQLLAIWRHVLSQRLDAVEEVLAEVGR